MPKMLTSIGLMSGTSLDGIDVALVTTDGDERVARGAFRTYAYDTRARAMLRQAIADARSLRNREDRPGSLAVCERELTAWHADAVFVTRPARV